MKRIAKAVLYVLMFVALIAASGSVVASDTSGGDRSSARMIWMAGKLRVPHGLTTRRDGIRFGRLPTARCFALVTALAFCGTTNY